MEKIRNCVMRKECYTAPITAEEKARFVPFMHMLIDTAFDVIVPVFFNGARIER